MVEDIESLSPRHAENGRDEKILSTMSPFCSEASSHRKTTPLCIIVCDSELQGASTFLFPIYVDQVQATRQPPNSLRS
jgi:hypothetical protein